MTDRDDPSARMISKLRLLSDLSQDDEEAIRRLTFRVEPVAASQTLVREGSTSLNCCLLVDGYACRYKVARDGGRQIVSFHLRGDMLDLQHLLFDTADHSIQTISRGLVAWISMSELKALCAERPRVAQAFWRDTLIDASIFREWVLNIGRRDAKSRIAHMLCEFAARREAIGLGSAERFELPMTQEEIADATGLTGVHVNRTLRVLREAGVIDHQGRQLSIVDWAGLKRIAGFDPSYLHAAA